MKFAKQIVWITGASSGLGEALARAFAREGARLILSSRRVDELERVRLSCANPESHRVIALDLARVDSLPAVVNEVLAQVGAVDVLVNNGGVSQRARALETAANVERTIMEVDYFAPVTLTKAVLPSMCARRSGQIVVVSSVMGYVGTPGRSSYAAAKHALHGYFDSLRAEVWHDNIHITLACPGYIRTNISGNALGPNGETHAQMDASTERGMAPDECARAIVRAVARKKNEAYVGGREVIGIYLQRFVPALFARIVRRMTFSVDRVK